MDTVGLTARPEGWLGGPALGGLALPYGIWRHKNRLAIAGPGNNRVIVRRLGRMENASI